jgi:hypothetical protein
MAKFVYLKELKLNSSCQETYELHSAPDAVQTAFRVDILFIPNGLRINSSNQRG